MSDARRRILERRARFLAAALGATAATACDRANPLVCLEPAPLPKVSAAPEDAALGDATADVDASDAAPADASTDAAPGDAGGDATPKVCLRVSPPPPPKAKPRPCLTELFESNRSADPPKAGRVSGIEDRDEEEQG